MDKSVVELFAGVGGFHCGLKQADENFNIVWANQWEPGKTVQHAFNCYKSHFSNSTICVNEDIGKVRDTVPTHSLLVGGFPCQDYSVAATGAKGIQGKKGVLWWDIRHILKNKKPPFVLLENVDRLLKSPSSQRGRDFGIMLHCFKQLGYSVEWRVINAAEYGFAQRRRRIFIFAYKNTTKYGKLISKSSPSNILYNNGLFAKAFPIINEGALNETHFNKLTKITDVSNKFVYDFGNSGYMHMDTIYTYNTTPINQSPTTLAQILEHNVDAKYFIGNDLTKWSYLKGAKSVRRTSKTGHVYNFTEGAIAFPDPLDKPSRTMLTSEASINRSTHVVTDLDTNRLRLLTPVECERLNGFDDNWTNSGMTESMRYFCMGNALVVGIIKRLGIQISNIIEKE